MGPSTGPIPRSSTTSTTASARRTSRRAHHPALPRAGGDRVSQGGLPGPLLVRPHANPQGALQDRQGLRGGAKSGRQVPLPQGTLKRVKKERKGERKGVRLR